MESKQRRGPQGDRNLRYARSTHAGRAETQKQPIPGGEFRALLLERFKVSN